MLGNLDSDPHYINRNYLCHYEAMCGASRHHIDAHHQTELTGTYTKTTLNYMAMLMAGTA